jgi:predicted Fe-Mo cluster-binding NifX family protein
MLAGNMGEGAKNVLEYHEIKVIRGCSGLVEDVVKAYINGQISDSGLSCSHHECHN